MSNLKDKQKACARGKDTYWNCLDHYKKSFPENYVAMCKKERADFEGACTKTWLKYWDKRLPYMKWQNAYVKGDNPGEQPTKNAASNLNAPSEEKKAGPSPNTPS